MLGFHLRLSLTCPGCAQPVPLDALAPVVTCVGCGRGVPIELRDWKNLLETAVIQTIRGAEQVSFCAMDTSIEWEAAVASPRCSCGALLTEAELSSAGGATPWFRHGCGAQVLLRSFPELDTIGRVVGESNPSAPSPPGAGFIVTLSGWLGDRVRNAVRFTEVTHAVVDGAGNVYCAGRVYVTTPREDDPGSTSEGSEGDDDDEDALTKNDDDEYCMESLWSYDAALRLRWRVDLPSSCTQLALLTPGAVTCVTAEEKEPTTFSMADGSGFGATEESVHLSDYDGVVRDTDGTWVVATEHFPSTDHAVARVAPTQGWSAVPLFDAPGLPGRRTTTEELPCRSGAAFAVASDGDLVLHYAEVDEPLQFARFDGQGRCKVTVPSPLLVVNGDDAQLATGLGGTVWVWGDNQLFAVTPLTAYPVALPPDTGSLQPAFAAMTDGSLLFFGETGRVLRATMNGVVIVRWDQVAGV